MIQAKKDSSASLTGGDQNRPKQVYMQPPGKGPRPLGGVKPSKKKPEVVCVLNLSSFLSENTTNDVHAQVVLAKSSRSHFHQVVDYFSTPVSNCAKISSLIINTSP